MSNFFSGLFLEEDPRFQRAVAFPDRLVNNVTPMGDFTEYSRLGAIGFSSSAWNVVDSWLSFANGAIRTFGGEVEEVPKQEYEAQMGALAKIYPYEPGITRSNFIARYHQARYEALSAAFKPDLGDDAAIVTGAIAEAFLSPEAVAIALAFGPASAVGRLTAGTISKLGPARAGALKAAEVTTASAIEGVAAKVEREVEAKGGGDEATMSIAEYTAFGAVAHGIITGGKKIVGPTIGRIRKKINDIRLFSRAVDNAAGELDDDVADVIKSKMDNAEAVTAKEAEEVVAKARSRAATIEDDVRTAAANSGKKPDPRTITTDKALRRQALLREYVEKYGIDDKNPLSSLLSSVDNRDDIKRLISEFVDEPGIDIDHVVDEFVFRRRKAIIREFEAGIEGNVDESLDILNGVLSELDTSIRVRNVHESAFAVRLPPASREQLHVVEYETGGFVSIAERLRRVAQGEKPTGALRKFLSELTPDADAALAKLQKRIKADMPDEEVIMALDDAIASTGGARRIEDVSNPPNAFVTSVENEGDVLRLNQEVSEMAGRVSEMGLADDVDDVMKKLDEFVANVRKCVDEQ